MDVSSELLKSLIDDSVQRALEKKKSSEEYYKNLNKHTQCSKCHEKITHDNYTKDRSICRKCYSKYMLEYNSSKRGDYDKVVCSRKQDVSSKTDSSDNVDSSNNFDSLNKQESSRKQVRSRKQDSSNKEDLPNKQVRTRKQIRTKKQDSTSNQERSNIEDLSINNITDAEPDLLCDKLRETLSKSVMLESDYTMVQMIIDEILRVRCITRKHYKAMCEKIGLKYFI